MFRSPQTSRKLKFIALLLYTAIMLLLLFKRTPADGELPYWDQMLQCINLTPFQTIETFLYALLHGSLSQKRLAVINLVGNVVMFVPFGYLLPDLFPKFRRFFPFFLKCLALISLVEILQPIALVGILDIDDVILNMVGFSLGYWVYRLIQILFPPKES